MSLPPPFSPQLIVNENCFLHIPIKLIQDKKKNTKCYTSNSYVLVFLISVI